METTQIELYSDGHFIVRLSKDEHEKNEWHNQKEILYNVSLEACESTMCEVDYKTLKEAKAFFDDLTSNLRTLS